MTCDRPDRSLASARGSRRILAKGMKRGMPRTLSDLAEGTAWREAIGKVVRPSQEWCEGYASRPSGRTYLVAEYADAECLNASPHRS